MQRRFASWLLDNVMCGGGRFPVAKVIEMRKGTGHARHGAVSHSNILHHAVPCDLLGNFFLLATAEFTLLTSSTGVTKTTRVPATASEAGDWLQRILAPLRKGNF